LLDLIFQKSVPALEECSKKAGNVRGKFCEWSCLWL